MQSEKQIEAAARAICAAKGLNPDCLHQINVFDGKEHFDSEDDRGRRYVIGWRLQEKFARAALEAALSAAEPVGWFNLPNDAHGYQQVAKEFERKTGTIPLYAAIPALPVTVKELQWDEDGDNLKARMGDREWMLNVTSDGKTWAGSTRPFVFGRNLTWSSVPNCSMVSLEAAKAACQADCQARYAALSAQVQEVAGWQSMDTAPKDGSEFAAGRRYSPDGEFVVHTYRWVGPPNYWNSKRNGVCIRPSYQDDYMWCPLPAAPANQEGKP